MSKYFTDNGYEADFIENNDIIVSLNSQLSGYNINTPTDFCSTYPDDRIAHTKSFMPGEGPILFSNIQDQINTLLNSDVTSDFFTASIKATGEASSSVSLANKAERKNIIKRKNEKASTENDSVKIVFPIANSEYIAGDTINIKIEADTVGLQELALFFQNQISVYLPDGNQIEYQLTVNPAYVDIQTIVVVGKYVTNDTSYISYANLDIKVNPVDSIIDFNISPEVILIEKGKSARPEFEAVFPNAIATIGQTDLISAIIADSEIVTYNAENNRFEGLTEGKTHAEITYRGITKTLFFEVLDPQNVDDDIGTKVDVVSLANNNPLHIQTYPNPFADKLTFEFELYKSSNTKLEIYNVYGMKIKEIDFGELLEGTYQKDVGLKELISGIYIYKLTVGKYTQGGRVIKM